MFNDWNGDGKTDWQDEFLEYQMMNDDTFGSNSCPSSSSGNTGCLVLLIVVNIFLALLDLFTG